MPEKKSSPHSCFSPNETVPSSDMNDFRVDKSTIILLMDSIPLPVFCKSLDGRYLGCNKAFESFAGKRRKSLVGAHFSSVWSAGLADQYTQQDQQTLASDEIQKFECTILNAQQQPRDIVIYKARFANKKGKISGIIGSFFDVTEENETRKELLCARESASAANRAKSHFLASMSHDIRTPLHAITGIIELFGDTPLTALQKEYMQIVKTSSKTLLTLISGIIDISKLETGKVSFDNTSFEWLESIYDIVNLLRETAIRKGLELVIDIDYSLPDSIIGDAGRLQQILLNLLGNAIKFTNEGEVVLSVSGSKIDNDTIMMSFVIKDTGEGISKQHLADIFEPFNKASKIQDSLTEGAGLGLAVTKQLVEAMGGTISLVSSQGKGSTFRVDLPFSMTTNVEIRHKNLLALADTTFLIVNSNSSSRRALARMLKTWGAKIIETDNSRETMELLSNQDNPIQLDGIFIDHKLKESKGTQLVKQIREIRSYINTPIFLLLYSAVSGDSASWLTLPNEYNCISKPLKIQQVCHTLTSAMRYKTASDIVLKANNALIDNLPPPPFPESKILVAEDNIVNQKVMQAMLAKLGYSCDIATNGFNVLEQLQNNHYSLILMDCQMPHMDGYETTREIRQKQGTLKDIPIIAVTAEAIRGDRERCLTAGMNDYLSKPLSLGDLDKKLRKFLS